MMRIFVLFAALLVATPVWAEPAQSIVLDRTKPARTELGSLAFRGALVLPPSKGRFGGLSGLAVAEDGASLVALSDVNRVFRLKLQYDAKGMLKNAVPDAGLALSDEADAPKNQGKARIDSEAFARVEGGWLVAYERQHRIMKFESRNDAPAGVPVALPAASGWQALPDNSGIETLASWPDGRLIAIGEVRRDRSNPAWLWQDGNWHELRYKSASGFAPSDAAVLPDGDLLVLERGFNLFFGFRARIVKVPAAAVVAGALLEGEELARLESPVISENFEGLAVGRAPDGGVRIYVVSDNNFNAAQQTILAVFDLISPAQSPR